MQINPNNSTGAVNRVPDPAPAVKRVAADGEADSATFSNTDDIHLALAGESDIRAEKLERALNLVGQVQWPPQQVIQGISTLLAMHLGRAAE